MTSSFSICRCTICLQEWEEKRRQNIEKMNEEMEMIAEYERGQRVCSGQHSLEVYLTTRLLSHLASHMIFFAG